jgi:hypothetical protein
MKNFNDIISTFNATKLKLQHSTQRGFHCVLTADCDPNEELFVVPRKWLLTKEAANADLTFVEIAQTLEKALLKVDDWNVTLQEELVLLLFLVKQKLLGRESKWWNYIQILPTDTPFPIFWSDDDLQRRLEGTPLYGLVMETKMELKNAWDWCVDLLGDRLEGFTLELFLWAYSMVQSRAYRVRLPSGELLTAMVPFADFSNHVSNHEEAMIREMHQIDQETNQLIARCNPDKGFKMGDEMTMHYNDLANWQLVLHYGFCLENNPFDRVNLSLDPDSLQDDEDSELQVRKELFLELCHEDLLLDHSLGADVPKELWATLRLLLATRDELEGITIANIQERLIDNALSLENEERCQACLKGMLHQLSQSMIREDEGDLFEDVLSNMYRREQVLLLKRLMSTL